MALVSFLPGKVVIAADARYSSLQASYWSGQEQGLTPNCIVIPSSTQDVSTAVKILSLGYEAAITSCKFAVRSAGHTPHAGSANINGGVTIDLQSLNQVTIFDDQKSVSVGPGNRWGNVYRVLDDLDLAMVGGRVTSVGVGGLLTGGSISFFSGRYGFACNNIQQYEVVLANGSIVTASSTSNPTLFRALKGSSNNFSIVTRFDAKLYPQSAFWGGQLIQATTVKSDVFRAIVNFTRSATYDPYAALISTFIWASGAPVVIQHETTYTSGNVTWPPPTFQELDAIPRLSSTVRKDILSSFTDEQSTGSDAIHGHQNAFVTLSVVNKPAVSTAYLSQAWDLVNTAVLDLVPVAGMIITMAMQPLPQLIYSKDASRNVLGLGRFQDDLINIPLVSSWPLPVDDDKVFSRLQKLESDLVALAEEKAISNEWLYLNYAAQWQHSIRGYGADNVAFMKGVSKTYDPAGIVQKAVPGGFKLSI